MDISKLQNKNGYIKIAAMDHRGSLKEYLNENKLWEFKNFLTKSFAPYSTAILVDPEYGHDAIKTAKENGLAVLLSREKTGYVDNPDGRITEIYQRLPSKKLKDMGADAIKILLYYNSDSKNANDQLDIIRRVREETINENLPFLIEPITYEIKGRKYNKAEQIINAVKDLRDLCDILKLEYPIDVNEEGSNIETAEGVLKEIKTLAKQPWVLLSRGMKYENYKRAVVFSKKHGCMGYAVGRAVWQEFTEQGSWEGIEEFISTTATNRMQELSKIYD